MSEELVFPVHFTPLEINQDNPAKVTCIMKAANQGICH